jgi:hypothetical protein
LIEELGFLVSSLLIKADKQPARSAKVDGKDNKVAYDVVVDAVGINWEQAGPLFERYAVSLAGQVDRIWVDCYKRLLEGSREHARFRLDPATSEVSFTTRSTDGPIQVMSVLKKLEAFVECVNQEATRTAVAPAPRETPTEAAKASISSLAAKLGIRRGEPH